MWWRSRRVGRNLRRLWHQRRVLFACKSKWPGRGEGLSCGGREGLRGSQDGKNSEHLRKHVPFIAIGSSFFPLNTRRKDRDKFRVTHGFIELGGENIICSKMYSILWGVYKLKLSSESRWDGMQMIFFIVKSGLLRFIYD